MEAPGAQAQAQGQHEGQVQVRHRPGAYLGAATLAAVSVLVPALVLELYHEWDSGIMVALTIGVPLLAYCALIWYVVWSGVPFVSPESRAVFLGLCLLAVSSLTVVTWFFEDNLPQKKFKKYKVQVATAGAWIAFSCISAFAHFLLHMDFEIGLTAYGLSMCVQAILNIIEIDSKVREVVCWVSISVLVGVGVTCLRLLRPLIGQCCSQIPEQSAARGNELEMDQIAQPGTAAENVLEIDQMAQHGVPAGNVAEIDQIPEQDAAAGNGLEIDQMAQ